MQMQLEVEDDILMARIIGEIDLAVADKMKDMVDERLKKEKISRLVLDLGGVSFIDSSGLGFILGRYNKITSQGGKMFIVRPRPAIARILEMSGIKRLIPIYASENELPKE
ncbi:MAG: anti-sigma factor antagonist [Syntrophomonadaceae bacterium]|nr:anti-sigma factor antagonist [Syntrophomonadaceae bacterium]